MHHSKLVFAYGSNMDPAQMRKRCPQSDLSWFIAEARGWKLCFPRRSDKRKGGVGSIVRDGGRSVWGVVFSVCRRDLITLDSFEGVPGSYERDRVDVIDQQGLTYRVWTYFAVAADKPPREYSPHKDYIDLYVRGAKYFGLPQDYVDFLRSLTPIAQGKKR